MPLVIGDRLKDVSGFPFTLSEVFRSSTLLPALIMNTEPAYTFELPSLEDDTVLNARIYHHVSLVQDLQQGGSHHPLKGAVVAHPYAPLGGSYDDHVVLSVIETLLEHGSVVVSFNFR